MYLFLMQCFSYFKAWLRVYFVAYSWAVFVFVILSNFFVAYFWAVDGFA